MTIVADGVIILQVRNDCHCGQRVDRSRVTGKYWNRKNQKWEG